MMNFQLFYFLTAVIAEPTVAKAVEEGAKNAASPDFWHTWLPSLISSIIITGIPGFWLWWRSRGKNKIDLDKIRVEQFSVFMNESQEMREEVRKEREALKIELLALQVEKKLLLEKIAVCEQNSKDYVGEIKKYTVQLETANKEIETLTLKIQGLKERVMVESNGNGNGKI